MNNYRSTFRSSILACIAIFSSLALINPAVAATITTTTIVSGTEMPWNWVSGGLNTSDQFGVNNGTAPDVISVSNGFDFTAGDVLTLTYLTGMVSVGPPFPNTNANGDTAAAVDNGTGSTGKVFPSFYMNPATYPINLGELVGTFANSSGAIVGTPFAVGNGPTTLTIPVGATRLQLGVNDDFFSDNTGSWSIQVSGPGSVVSGVPEPNGVVLCGFGLVLLAFVLHRRRTAKA
jgi:hypothetical protein